MTSLSIVINQVYMAGHELPFMKQAVSIIRYLFSWGGLVIVFSSLGSLQNTIRNSRRKEASNSMIAWFLHIL